MHPSQPDESPSDSDLIGAAFVGAQHKMMVHTAWVFIPVVMINFVFIACAALDKAPWWLVIPIPLAAIMLCGHQLWTIHRDNHREFSVSERRTILQTQSRQSVATAITVSAWGVAICFYAPQMSYFIAAVSGFTAIGSITYVAYLQIPMRLILMSVGVPMVFIVFAEHDFLSFVIAFCYGSNALLLELYVSSHFNTFSTVVAQHFDAQSKYHDSRRAQAEITRIANTDHLTGVMNRRGFLATVDNLIAMRRHGQSPFALGVIDLDGFKPVNDCFGHAAGDQVLIEVAHRLADTLGERGSVARLGGDEFAMLILNPADAADILETGKGAIQNLSMPIPTTSGTAQVSASCGFSFFPEDGTTPDMLLEHADEALYAVKGRHRSTTAIYDKRKEKDVLRRSDLEQRLRRAIASDQIYLEYQPIVSAETRALLGYEALARWKDSELGQISPGEFIPIAESSGLIGELSKHLLQQALQTAATWPDTVTLSFNLSPVSLADNALSLAIVASLNAANIAPDRLTLEITETAFAADHERTCELLQGLRQLGVRIAMDDFGVGYSSFANLDRLPVDILKLDRSFIAKVATDDRRRHIVAAIVEMCQRLDLFCIAEGIEEPAQLKFVAETGCDAAQGYLLGRPAPAEKLDHGQAAA